MSSLTSAQSNSRTSVFKAIIVAWLVAGTLDILAALTLAKASPDRVLQYIASGLFGRDAFSGGATMAVVGLVMHYMIAFTWTILFFILYPKIKFLRRQFIVSGLVYGIFVWIMMTRVMIPFFSRITPPPFNWQGALTGVAVLMFMIGLPISFFAHRYYTAKKAI